MKRIFVISIIALVVASCSQPSTPESNQKKVDNYKLQIAKLEQKIQSLDVSDSSVEKVILVKTQALTLDTISKGINFTSNIVPFEEVFLAPAAPGKIIKIYVEVGDRVNKGKKLVQMDQTQLVQARIQLESLQKDFERMKTLKETGSIPEQQFDQLKTQLEVLKSNVKFLEENTVVLAPFDGVITAKYFEDGENYSGAPNTQAGKAAIVTLQQISKVKAVVNVSESYFNLLSSKTRVEMTSDVFPGEIFLGTVYNVYPTIDPLSRSFKVEVAFNNPGLKLRPGMFGRIHLELGKTEALVVPAIAVLQQEGTNNRYIFIEKNGVARRVNVNIGERFNDKLELISDEIQPGDMLVVAGQAVLNNNNKVKVVQ
ncbi:MAG: efflux RND transporter periplasmic adaptor subunit [Prolixibacteraceae bacterium]|nr:efflux RND transporter periplasmic adaptor subunit [Prolixibacteraceae bacterium]